MNKELYKYVIDQSKEIKTLEGVLNLLAWDQETMMPLAGSDHRGTQRALLAGIIHNKKISNQFYDALHSLSERSADEHSDEKIQIDRLLEDATNARKLPTSFVEKFTIASSHAFSAWEKAKPESDWKLFEPHLTQIVDLVREKASLLGYKEHPLDALLDEYEPELTTKELTTLFSALKPKLQKLLEKIKTTPFYNRTKALYPASTEEQIQLCHDVLTSIGYDWSRSRLDTAAHPFSIATHPSDSRITIRYNHEDTLDQILSAMHEAGHSLYEMGLSKENYGTPLGEPASLSLHESQSRFWETIIGSSRMFSSHLSTLINKHVKTQPLPTPESLYLDLNSVRCSLIRTQADEVTYPFHVFLRFEIEKGLLEGSLRVQDIPEAWNTKMQEMLGITPSCHKEGCLQDIHWSGGMFGYFPTYVIGSMYAAAFWDALKKDLPEVKKHIQTGNFAPIHTWLHDTVWKHGRKMRSKNLVAHALGRLPSEKEYLSYLEEKYM